MRRLVVAAGKLQLDVSGKLAGRGAYICANADCWKRGATSDLLSKALKVELSAADRELVLSHQIVNSG